MSGFDADKLNAAFFTDGKWTVDPEPFASSLGWS
jgi:hypothetical protein